MQILNIAIFCILWYLDLPPDGGSESLPFVFLVGGGGGGASNQTVEKNLVPDWAQGAIENTFIVQAEQYYNEGFAAFSGATYAPQPTDETDGINAIAAVASAAPHALVASAEALLTAMMNGDKLNFNPKLDAEYAKKAEAQIQDFLEMTLPQINNSYGATGNYGSDARLAKQGLAARKLFDALSDTGIQVYYSDYKQEWGHVISSLPAARAYASQEAIDAEKLRFAGLLDREWRQGSLEDAFKADKDVKEAALRKHAFLLEATKTLIGASSKTVTPYYRPNSMGAIAGVATSIIGSFAMDKLTMADRPEGASQFATGYGKYNVMENPTYATQGMPQHQVNWGVSGRLP